MHRTMLLRSTLLSIVLHTVPFAVVAQERADEATPAARISTLEGFHIERLYSVPAAEQGSWVAMTVDPVGRLITSDQYGKLYRVTPPSVSGGRLQVEPIDLDIGRAHGLLCAFDSLYVMVNGKGAGLYRVWDNDGDDRYDEVNLLREIPGAGEHGPHAIVLSPDQRSLTICAGNHTDVPGAEASRIPRNWQEDQLLPRMWDAGGHAVGRLAPGGWIARIDPEGNELELICGGFRNEYDIAFNPAGELFTYDADMEWDVGTPWYRPTRVNHCISGGEFGWRSGTGKWPADYPDSFGSVVDIGPGSPTGIVFGTGAKFPERYQRALFIADWSYGVIYAVHLTPEGATYVGEREPFVSAAPLPVTDIVIHPLDGAMYFTTGGRRTQSGLYRLTYRGDEATTPALPDVAGHESRYVRKQLEALHIAGAPDALEKAWPYLASQDRAIRFAARIAIEHQPIGTWNEKALTETDPTARIHAIIALARNAERDARTLKHAVDALLRTRWDALSDSLKIDQMRAISLCLIRLGPEGGRLDSRLRDSLTDYLSQHYPASTFRQNRDLSQLLVYLQAPSTSARTVDLLEQAATQEEQIHYALVLRALREGWTLEERERYFEWFHHIRQARGGASFDGFLRNIRREAIATLTDEEKTQLATLLAARPQPQEPQAVSRQEIVKHWTVEDLLAAAQNGMQGRDFENGKEYFQQAGCFKCHRMAGDGGNTGPDLTGLGRRFDHRAMLEAIIEPSKVISDQYQSTQFVLDDGRVVVGRVVNLSGTRMQIMTNMLDPGNQTRVDRRRVEQVIPSSVSMMPTGLLDTFHQDEILDLLAYLHAGGDPNHEAFR